MAPARSSLDDLVRIHRIVNEGIRAGHKLHQSFAPIRRDLIGAPSSELIICHVGDLASAAYRYQAIAQRGSRVAKSEGTDPEIIEVKVALADFDYRERCGKRVEWNWEHHGIHLPTEYLLQRYSLLGRSVNGHRCSPRAEWLEEGQTLDVIPMGVRQQDVCAERTVPLLHQLMTEWTEPAPGVENDQTAAAAVDADAGGITAVSSCVGTRSWNRAPGSPERQCVSHVGSPAAGRGIPQPLLSEAGPSAVRVTQGA
jgi:hypothetical protein